jgi:DTW domain-containing protein YfiP
MAHLCLSNSLLFEGVDFSADDRVNEEIHNPVNFPVLLYPSADAINLSRLTPAGLIGLVPGGRKLVVIVLDGTWKSARKMIRLSHNLADCPRIRFDPPSPSAYRIRRQPAPHCYSTIEAVHYVADLFSARGAGRRRHDNLLEVFHSVVDRQWTYTP